VVVIGVGVGTGVTAAGEVGELAAEAAVSGLASEVLAGSEVKASSGVASGVASWPASWADRPPVTASRMEKIMARRIIDVLNTKR